jgi:hypothetical protein
LDCIGDCRAHERLAANGDRRAAGQPLPALDADVDKSRINLDQPGPAARAFRCNQRRAEPPKGSRITAPRFEQSRIASATMATGLTVGCRASLLFAVPLSAFWLT